MKLRGVISGFGEVAAQAHLPGWLSRPDAGIVAIQDPISERRHIAMRLHKTARIYDDLALMLDGESPDFVDITSPPQAHADAIRTSLTAGAHVICEKPLCLDIAEFDSLTQLAADKSRILMCVHNWKQSPAFVVARHALASGRIGTLRSVSIDRLRTQPAGGKGKWRSAGESGGGILVDHGWHAFYLAQWLMGGDEPLSVSAFLGQSSGGEIDDIVDLRLIFGADRIARVHLSWRAPVRRTSTALYGEKGIIEIEGDRVLLTEAGGKVEDISVKDAPDDSYHAAWFAGVAADFERAIAGGNGDPAARNLNEARTALRLISAARISAQSDGSPVPIGA